MGTRLIDCTTSIYNCINFVDQKKSYCVYSPSQYSLDNSLIAAPLLQVLTWVWFVQWTLVVWVHHDVTILTLLAHVSPRVATAPVLIASGTTKLTPHPLPALVRSFLYRIYHREKQILGPYKEYTA